MPFVAALLKLWHAVIFAVHVAKLMCRVVDRLDHRVQLSTMPDNIKDASDALKTSTHALCTLLQDYKAAL